MEIDNDKVDETSRALLYLTAVKDRMELRRGKALVGMF